MEKWSDRLSAGMVERDVLQGIPIRRNRRRTIRSKRNKGGMHGRLAGDLWAVKILERNFKMMKWNLSNILPLQLFKEDHFYNS